MYYSVQLVCTIGNDLVRHFLISRYFGKLLDVLPSSNYRCICSTIVFLNHRRICNLRKFNQSIRGTSILFDGSYCFFRWWITRIRIWLVLRITLSFYTSRKGIVKIFIWSQNCLTLLQLVTWSLKTLISRISWICSKLLKSENILVLISILVLVLFTPLLFKVVA